MTALGSMEFLRVDPVGAGSMASISVDRATGGAAARVPIPLTLGRDGLGPSLALAYSGYDPLSPFAHGWTLEGLPSVEIDTRDGLPRYDGSEKYKYGGQELVPLEGTRPHSFARLGHAVRVYAARLQSSIVRVERWSELLTSRVHFRARLPNGTTQVFGRRSDGESRISEPGHPERTFRWLLESVVDRLGNAMFVRHQAEDGVGLGPADIESGRFVGSTANRYPKRILYGNALPLNEHDDSEAGQFRLEAVFDYGDHDSALPLPEPSQPWGVRSDVGFSGRAGFEVRTRRLCRRVLMFHRFPSELGEPATLVSTIEFRHTETAAATTLTGTRLVGWRRGSVGRVCQSTPWSSVSYTERGGEDAFRLHTLPSLGDDTVFIDLFGEGAPGLLTRRLGEARFARNLGDGAFGPHEVLAGWPLEARPGGLVDIDGDGNVELAQLTGPSAGFYRFDRHTRRFERYRQLRSTLNVDAGVLTADMTGDGRPDLVLLHERGLSIYPFRSGGEGTWDFECPIEVTLDASRLPVGSAALRRFLADMTGDGLPDIVEVERGAVRYYPNLGWGRFGDVVWMDSPPVLDGHLEYDPSRVLFADLTGTGASDILYLRRDGTVLYAENQRGASFGALVPLAEGAPISSTARVETGDFYGDGSSCLIVYSAHQHVGPGVAVYVLRLVDAPGPRQLLSSVSPLGATTVLEWGHSLRHFRRDEAEGSAWACSLPSHRPVVDAIRRTEPVDGQRTIERLRYREGYFDPRTRSFALFAATDHFDADVNAAVDVVPKMSRQFVHTGEQDYWDRYARLRYAGDSDAPSPPLEVVDGDTRRLADFEEAWGALRGATVREEVFSAPSGVPSENPLSVAETSHKAIVSRLADDLFRTGVSVVPWHSRSSIYEEARDDPRVSVRQTVAVDPYLVSTCTFSAGLPRRPSATVPVRFDAQDRLVATASTVEIIHVDTETRFELAIPKESRSFEVHAPDPGIVLGGQLATPLEAAIASASGYATALDHDSPTWAARHLSHARSVYWNDGRTDALPLGAVGAVVLPHHVEQAAYDRVQLEGAVGTLLDIDAELPTLGYIETSGVFYAKGPVARFSDASSFFRLAESEAHDGGVSVFSPDVHHFVLRQTTDPVGNTTSSEIDYHVLAPFRITDPNGTEVEVEYDALGVTRRMSRRGHAMTTAGDLVEHGFEPLAAGWAPPTIDEALAAPETALGTAEAVFLYDYPPHAAPMRVLGLRAEQFVHRGPDAGSDAQRAQVTLTYHDGFGRALQSRTLAEPGPAWVEVAGVLIEQPTAVRWLVSGYVELDGRQQPRGTFEPFFHASHAWESAVDRRRFGVAATTDRDAVGRPIKVSFPNGTFATTSYSAFSQTSSDPNDTSASATGYVNARQLLPSTDPERIALQQALATAGTPVSTHLDPVGQPIATREVVETSNALVERTTRDARGLSLSTTDRRGLTVSTRTYDCLQRPLSETSADAGTRHSLLDAAGREAWYWHEGTTERRSYDVAGRPTEHYVTTGASTKLLEAWSYGEGLPSAAAKNQLGRVVFAKDGAGTFESRRYGAFGEALESVRTLTTLPGEDPDWSTAVPLEATTHTSRAAVDAVGRPTKAFLADGTERRYTYHRSGPLSSAALITPDSSVHTLLASADYNARGQEVRRQLGNGVEVTSSYDDVTTRLYRRHATLGADSFQDLRHHYDPVGNLVYTDDLAQRPTATYVINGLTVTAERVFTYDARYQLVRATGRVHNALTRQDFRGDAPTSGSFRGTRRVGLNDGGAVSRYERDYTYDASGNLLGWSHAPEGVLPGNSWNHEKWVSPTSNRSYLAYDLDGAPIANPTSKFDDRGQLIELPNVRSMHWSATGQLRKVVLIERTGAPDDDETYDYAVDGKRLRKTIRRLVAGNVETTETVYLDGCELRRVRVSSAPPTPDTTILERWSSHIELSDGRLATLYRWMVDINERETDDVTAVRTHFHLASNVGSVALELDASGALIGYEEYFPYGGTAFVAGDSVLGMSLRTRRFAGKDQDDATGFSVFHFRYYAHFLGNWVSPDPAGEVDGPNRYWYARNNPTTLEDTLGLYTEVDFASAPGTVQLSASARFARGDQSPYIFVGITTDAKTLATERGLDTGYRLESTEADLERRRIEVGGTYYEVRYESWVAYMAVVGQMPVPGDTTTPGLASTGSTGDGTTRTGSEGGDGAVGDLSGELHEVAALDATGNDDPLAGIGGDEEPAREEPSRAGSSAGPGRGMSGDGRGGPQGTGDGPNAGPGSGVGAPGMGRGSGAGTTSDRERRPPGIAAQSSAAPTTGGSARSRGTDERQAPPIEGLPGGVAGGTGAAPVLPGFGGGTPTGPNGGGAPLPGIAGAAVGTASGLGSRGGTGATFGSEGGTANGSLFGSQGGTERGSILAGGEGGTSEATVGDLLTALAQIANHDYAGYDPQNPDAREHSGGGTFGWIDLGDWNQVVWLASAFGLAALGLAEAIRDARRLAGEIVDEGGSLLEAGLEWVGRQWRRLSDAASDALEDAAIFLARNIGVPGLSVGGVGLTPLRIGRDGERIARRYLRGLGYNVLGAIQNTSGHGIDLVARDANGALVFFEVKTTAGMTAPVLSAAQAQGVASFVDSRLKRALKWGRVHDPRTADIAQALLDEIDASAGVIRGEVLQITLGNRGITRVPW